MRCKCLQYGKNGNEKNGNCKMREASYSRDGSMSKVRALESVEANDHTIYDIRTLCRYCTGGY